MKLDLKNEDSKQLLEFHGGLFGALTPFIIFIVGVVTIALAGAPDEKGFWPILLLAIGVGLILAKNRTAFSEIIISGMSQKIVMIMIMAWMLASIIGVLMTLTGFVEALIWISDQLSLDSISFVITTYIICCIVSLSTGSSFATILICSPLLYPTGGILGAHLPSLAGAIIGGAAFGDFIAPISDTTIASALSQQAKIGKVVKSRIKYVAPAAVLALIGYTLTATLFHSNKSSSEIMLAGESEGLLMLAVPIVTIFLFLKGKHLVHGLLFGLLFGTLLGVISGLLSFEQVISLDLENFAAKSFVIEGIYRAVGLSVFTMLLMGLVATLKASGIMTKLVNFATLHTKTKKQAESWIISVMSAAVLFTTHSIVAILMVTDFSNKTGDKLGIPKIRRANLLSLVACIFPFVLPYFIPVILMANMTNTGQEFGVAQVSSLDVGLYNFMSWGLLIVTLMTIFIKFKNVKHDK